METQSKAANHLKVVRDDPSRGAGLAKVAFLGDEQAFLQALRKRDPAATTALFDAHQGIVLAVLARVLGVDSELRDLLQEVFVRALRGVHTVRDGRVLQQWLRQIAVCTAMDCLRRRRRRRWLKLVAPSDLEEPTAPPANSEAREAIRHVYRVLDTFPPEERLVFTLRTFAGLELREVASASKCSLATIKRRLSRAELRFESAARSHPVLSLWLEEGDRWGQQ
jgi:RNA polymerase sigma-70 factor (ECF subfamily)